MTVNVQNNVKLKNKILAKRIKTEMSKSNPFVIKRVRRKESSKLILLQLFVKQTAHLTVV